MHEEEQSAIRLTFEKFNDINHNQAYFLFIYSSKINCKDNKLLCYDIVDEQIVKEVAINPKVTHYLYADDQGFNTFKLVRTSDKVVFKNACRPNDGFASCYDYSLFTLFNPKLGRIEI